MHRTRLRRFGLVVTAVFQLLLPAFASVADARAEAAAERGAHAHVESHSTSHCVPAHSADCAVCRVIAGGASIGHAPTVQVSAIRVISATLPGHDRVSAASPASRAASQRAPPTT